MRGITKVVQTDLYLDSLDELRGTPYYEQLCGSIQTCITNKIGDVGHVGNNDRPFSAQKELRGIWHCHLVKSPLKILFYTVSGDVLTLCKVGDHDDYGWKGKNSGAAERLVHRIANAVARGNVPYADWEGFRWRRPSAVIGHRDVALMSRQALDRIDGSLVSEFESLAILTRRHGGDPSKVSVDAAIAWMTEIEDARQWLGDIMESRLVLEKAFRNGRDAVFAMSEPTRDQIGQIVRRMR
jgi:mRNA-degrading endonuclease YafQ of YafQ-DinJ toxin-antitoxin module